MTASIRTGRPFTTTLLIPTLNEIDGMRVIMPQVEKRWVDQILVLDGNSTDGTIEYALDQGYDLHVQREKGIRVGYMEILDLIKGDVVLTFSPDGNSPPEAIPRVLDEMERGRDMVIASRYLDDAKSDDDDVVTRFGNWLFTKTVNLLHRANYTDVMVIYRAYWKQMIYELDLDKERSYRTPERLFHTKISWEPLLSVRAAKQKLSISEIPCDEPARIGGERKLQVLRWGAAYYYQFWRELFCWRKPLQRTWGIPAAPQTETLKRAA
jgi:glycosyltransferase involved in cell wall biosynthesis